MRPTRSMRAEDVDRRWWVFDVQDLVVGRAATEVARILRGKHKPTFTPHVDDGDFVIVINAAGLRLTGRKAEQKLYHRYSGYPGGLRTVTAGRLLDKRPERLFETVVRGMMPKNPLGRRMARKLKVYAGPNHPHKAQKPAPLEIGR
jgi:large subunit ribosomal protein L13